VPDAGQREQICRELAGLLKKEREKRKLSKNMLAQKSGLSRRMIGFVESGARNPTVDTLLRITEALNIRLESLIKAARKKP